MQKRVFQKSQNAQPRKKINISDDPKFVTFIQNRLDVVRAYCINIAFYLRLRAKAVPDLNDHPVIGRLAQLKVFGILVCFYPIFFENFWHHLKAEIQGYILIPFFY